jgi:hypothetical protein
VSRRARGSLPALIALLGLAAFALSARAEVAQHGNLRVSVSGELRPRSLPRTGSAPIAVSIGGRIATTDGSAPPQLQQLQIEINRHGRFEYGGLPVCRISQIQPASNARALSACRPALVGEGKFSGTVALPGSAEPFPMQGPLLLFNGRSHGRPVLLGHIYSAHPFTTSFVITFAIDQASHGQYGTTLTADLAKALGPKRSLTDIEMTLSRRYRYRGASRSYISAGCPAAKGFPGATFPLARTRFSFVGGIGLTSVLTRSCRAMG